MLVDFSSCSVKLQCPLYVHKCIMEESLQLVILSFTIEIKTSDTCWVFVSCFWISFCVAMPHRIGYKLIHVQHSAIFKFIYNTVTSIVNFFVMFGKYELQGNVSKLIMYFCIKVNGGWSTYVIAVIRSYIVYTY